MIAHKDDFPQEEEGMHTHAAQMIVSDLGKYGVQMIYSRLCSAYQLLFMLSLHQEVDQEVKDKMIKDAYDEIKMAKEFLEGK